MTVDAVEEAPSLLPSLSPSPYQVGSTTKGKRVGLTARSGFSS